MSCEEFEEKRDPEKIFHWLASYIGHEHLMDIKAAPSLEKYLAIAPDIYVLASMLQGVLCVAAEQKAMAEYGHAGGEEKMQPWSELSEEEKILQAPIRKAYLAGRRAGRDTAMIEMTDRIVVTARAELDKYRLKNSEYDPALVVDEPESDEVL